MGPEADGAAVLGVEAGLDVLLEGVVGGALGRRTPDVASVGVLLEAVAVPLFDGVRRVGEDDVELFQPIGLDEGGVLEGIPAYDAELIDAVQEHIHAGDGAGEEVYFLAVEFEVSVFLAFVAQVEGAVEQQATATAGGVVDGFPGFGGHEHGHEFHDGAVGVELGGGVAAVVGELFDEVFVGVSQLVVGDVGEAEVLATEVLDEVEEGFVGEALFVGPAGAAEDAAQGGVVGAFQGHHCVLDGGAYVFGGCAHVGPVRSLGDGEAVEFIEAGVFFVASGVGQGGLVFLVVDITDALEEQEGEDVLFVVSGVDGAAQGGGGTP